MKPKYIREEVYRENIYILYGSSSKVLEAAIKEMFGVEVPSNPSYDGRCLEIAGKQKGRLVRSIWIWTRYRDPAALAHECLHAVEYILQNRISFTDVTVEAYCYLLEMLVRRGLEKD